MTSNMIVNVIVFSSAGFRASHSGFAFMQLWKAWEELHSNVKIISVFGFLFHCGWSIWER